MTSSLPSLTPPPAAAPARGRHVRRRVAAVALFTALPALVAGVVVGARHEDSARTTVERFLAAWAAR